LIEPSLLSTDEPPATTVMNPDGTGHLLLVCDHASRRIPVALGTLGLGEADLAAHIAWDIGAAEVARRLSTQLDATLLLQNYSRLVIDCNRPPQAADSAPAVSGGITIPGNQGLDAAELSRRRSAIFDPYHARLRNLLNLRAAARRLTLLVAIHSFTPSYPGAVRPWHTGLMYHRDARLAQALLALLRADPALCVGDNEPYAMGDTSDYTLPLHGEGRGILHVGIEIRQDLLSDTAGQQGWADRLAILLPRALEAVTTRG
jgi:predicted N-formylglutamate amidohydrolase